MKYLSKVLIIFTVFPISSGPANAGHAMRLQVTDTKEHPIPRINIHISGYGISGPDTNREGTTCITLPKGIGPSDPVRILLDERSSRVWFLITPWNRTLIVPRADVSAEIVLGKQGDRDVLYSNAGMKAVLSDINTKLDVIKASPQSITEEKLLSLRQEHSKGFGFSPTVIDAAVKQRRRLTTDYEERNLIHHYESDLNSILGKLAVMPDYALKDARMKRLIPVERMVRNAISSFAFKIKFASTDHGVEPKADWSSVRLHMGVVSTVDRELSAIPYFTITVGDDENLLLTGEHQGKNAEIFKGPDKSLNQEMINQLVEKYFEPILYKTIDERNIR